MNTTTIDNDTGAIVLQTPEGLELATANSLQDAFAAYFQQADEWRKKALAITVNDAGDKKSMQEARVVRLALKDIRVSAEKRRKALKEDSLRYGRAIDGCYNMLAHAIAPLERHLQDQEDYAARIEAERIAKLKDERLAALAPYNYQFAGDITAMTDEQFAGVLKDAEDLAALKAKREREAEEARIKAEQEAAAERERVRLENERLKAEAAAREAEMKAERERVEAERKAAEEVARKEREAIEAKARAEAAARAKAEKELADRLAKEEAAKKAEAAARKKAANAPDKTKILALAAAVRAIPLPVIGTNDGKAVLADVATLIEALAVNIEKQASSL